MLSRRGCTQQDDSPIRVAYGNRLAGRGPSFCRACFASKPKDESLCLNPEGRQSEQILSGNCLVLLCFGLERVDQLFLFVFTRSVGWAHAEAAVDWGPPAGGRHGPGTPPRMQVLPEVVSHA